MRPHRPQSGFVHLTSLPERCAPVGERGPRPPSHRKGPDVNARKDRGVFRNPLSPRGRGMRRLGEHREPSRSWVRGLRPVDGAHSARALRWRGQIGEGALTSARTRWCGPLTQLRLSSHCSLSLRILPPQGGKGSGVMARDSTFYCSETFLSSARPFSKSDPTILSISMNRHMTLLMKGMGPYMDQVTSVASPLGCKSNSAVLLASIGL